MTVVGAGVARAIMGESRFVQFLHDAIQISGLNLVRLASDIDGESTSLGNWLNRSCHNRNGCEYCCLDVGWRTGSDLLSNRPYGKH